MAERGKFIVFEGIDCCGKGTQFKLLHGFLWDLSKFNHIITTREPYKSREVRQIMAKDDNPYSQAERCAELFIADRAEHIANIIEPNLRAGMTVLSDRYKHSTIAYQSAQGLDMQALIRKHEGMPVPDLTFIIDIPAEVAAERKKKQENGREKKFEDNIEFNRLLRQNYLALKTSLPREDIRVIEGARTIEEVAEEVRGIYLERFP